MGHQSEKWSNLIIKSNETLLQKYDNFIFDADGVLWIGNDPIPQSQDFLQNLQKSNKNIFIVTNATQKTRIAVKQKLQDKFDIEVNLDHIFTSSYLAAIYIKANNPNAKKAYVVGSKIIQDELKEIGVDSTGTEHNQKYYYEKYDVCFETIAADIKAEEDSTGKYDIVVTGIDPMVNNYKLNFLVHLLQKGCSWITTNTDKRAKGSDGNYYMGAWSIGSIIESCVRSPDAIAGKPNKFC